MGLTAGTNLGSYEIISPLGAGGMGEVYRALDTRLDRTVAVKTLPAHLSENPEAKRRFEREARAISSLNHPNICQLYDIGSQDGIDFIVMEFLEGETLADRLSRGPLQIEQVLKYGIEICEALEKAHSSGLIHRDLKPGNIMLTKTGAKLMDFGLAKMSVIAPVHNADTVTVQASKDRVLTEKGVILGTFQYMAPEQLEGKLVDARTDLFALGTVLYEMMTGECPFKGGSPASLIASILSHEPAPMTTRQPLTPPALDRVVKACLEKDPDERWERAHDVKLELNWIAEDSAQREQPVLESRRKNRERLAWATSALLATFALITALYHPSPKGPPPIRFVLQPPPDHTLNTGDDVPALAAISPDGSKLGLVAMDAEGKTSLWLRSLDSASATPLPGTESAETPVWSPDSRFLLFVSEGKLKRIDSAGGIADTLCDVKGLSVGGVNANGIVLLASNFSGNVAPGPIQQLSIDDCNVKPITSLNITDYDFGHHWPSFLPDGRHFLFAGLRTNKKHDVLLGTLGSNVSEVLIHNASDAKYAAPEYLLFERNGFLFAQSFSLRNLRVSGEAVQLASQPLVFGSLIGAASYDVSGNGVLTYSERPKNAEKLLVRDETGKQLIQEDLDESSFSTNLRIAPDHRKVLIDRISSQTNTGDLWTFDLQRKTWERVSFESSTGSHTGVWSPTGKSIVYASAEAGIYNLRRRSMEGPPEPELLAKSPTDQIPMDWSPDGKFLLFTQAEVTGPNDLWVAPMLSQQKPFSLAQTHFDEKEARFSPDGKHFVYSSNESGRREVYLNSFPTGARTKVSSGGGQAPQWSSDGKSVFYLTLDWKLVEVPLKSGITISAGLPHNHFSVPRNSRFEVIRDKTFLILESSGTSYGVTVMLNWSSALSPRQ